MKKILNTKQKKFLEEFQKSELSKYFYWSGGTLLAYFYLQHRFSEDLDFFSEDLLPDEFIAAEILKIKKMTNTKKVFKEKKLNRHQFIFQYEKEALKIEFVYYPFPSIDKRKILDEHGIKNIKIDSLRNIAANKTHATFERYEPKDVFDLFYILQKGKFQFLQLFEWVEKKFGVEIDPVSFGAKIFQSVSQLEKIQPLIFFKKKNNMKKTVEKIEKFFKKEIFAYLKKKM